MIEELGTIWKECTPRERFWLVAGMLFMVGLATIVAYNLGSIIPLTETRP